MTTHAMKLQADFTTIQVWVCPKCGRLVSLNSLNRAPVILQPGDETVKHVGGDSLDVLPWNIEAQLDSLLGEK